MSEVFRIDIENHNGEVVTVLKNFQYFSFELRVARRDSFRIQLDLSDPNVDLIGLDYIARLWYKNPTYNIPWTNIFNGIVKTPSKIEYSNGRKLAIFYGSGPNELIEKALVMYSSDTPQAAKNTNALTAMYEHINENIGSQALISNGRFFDHVCPITINTVGSCGLTWVNNASHDLLIKTLQFIRDFSYENGDRIDFQTEYMGNYAWRVNIGKIYNDKTVNGLNINTGLNGAGNVPVILSPRFNNVDEYTETLSRIAESNTILALGRNMGASREYLTIQDANSVATSPIAQRESLMQSQNNTVDLSSALESALKESVGKTAVVISPKFSPGFALFRDLNLGDFFSVLSYDGLVINKQLDEIKLVIQQTTGGSTISQYTLFVEDREP